jgi:putative RNA 2'-phosphotransferase
MYNHLQISLGSMTTAEKKSKSKWLSLVLRHQPQLAGLIPDEQGWVSVQDLLKGSAAAGHALSLAELEDIVVTNDKQRFAFSEYKTAIRANQGHSIDVDLALQPVTPPAILYHGTVERFWQTISEQGLLKMSRQHVHLSDNTTTATTVGARRGKPLLLIVDAVQMHSNGCIFYKSDNGVWLTDAVPPKYISIKEE